MLEALITKDSRWCWILEEWEASSDEELLTLSETVHRFRENFVRETASLVSKVLGDIEGPDDVKKYKDIGARAGARAAHLHLHPSHSHATPLSDPTS
eukprot:COSAG06_NODE_27583_length_590_cov_1.050916_1_plen_96_part_01